MNLSGHYTPRTPCVYKCMCVHSTPTLGTHAHSCMFSCQAHTVPCMYTDTHAGQQVQALTCLEMMSFPSGMGAPFSVAILFKVAIAFSWFPDSTSYLALSGNHWGHRRARRGWLAWNRPFSPSHTLPFLCGVFKGRGSGTSKLASHPGFAICYMVVSPCAKHRPLCSSVS